MKFNTKEEIDVALLKKYFLEVSENLNLDL